MQLTEEEVIFLKQSNYIENERSNEALADAFRAWEYARGLEGPIGLEDVLEIHRLLMGWLAPDIAGKWRECDIWIGGQRKIYVGEEVLTGQLKDWLKDFNAKGHKKKVAEIKEEFAKANHVWFESIHPFADGNGRTGRIINLLYLIERGLLDTPILYLSGYIIDSKDQYYKNLLKVTVEGDWSEWVLYFLKAIRETSKWTMDRKSSVYRGRATVAYS